MAAVGAAPWRLERRARSTWLAALAGAAAVHVLVLQGAMPTARTADPRSAPATAQRVVPIEMLGPFAAPPTNREPAARIAVSIETRPDQPPHPSKETRTASPPGSAEALPLPLLAAQAAPGAMAVAPTPAQRPGTADVAVGSPPVRSPGPTPTATAPAQPAEVWPDATTDIAATPNAATLRGLPAYAAELPAGFALALQSRRLSPPQTSGEQRLATPGTGELRFERTAQGGYSLNLDLQWGARNRLEMHSLGQWGAMGLEPERLTDRRRGRSRVAANFDRLQREARFSGGAAAVPLALAAQDRLSWMVQLPAIVRADPALQRPGAIVWLQVVGARGGYQVWRLEALGTETLTLPDGSTLREAWHWRRTAENPYDVQVDAWLGHPAAPAPALVRLTPVPGGGAVEFWPAEPTPRPAGP